MDVSLSFSIDSLPEEDKKDICRRKEQKKKREKNPKKRSTTSHYPLKKCLIRVNLTAPIRDDGICLHSFDF